MVETPTEAAGRPPAAGRLTGVAALVTGVLLLSLNLRPAAIGLAPILADLRDQLGLSAVEMALLPALPILCFGLLAPAGPPLRRWLGEERTLGLVLVAILIGLGARAAVPEAALFAGTLLACAAIGVANVLVPSLIKRRIPFRAGLMAGLYTTTLAVSGSLATGLTVPVMEASGGSLRAALWLWTFPVVLGLAAWAPQLRYGPEPAPAGNGTDGAGRRVLFRSPLAWQVTLLMGLQSLLFYTAIGWLPTLLRSEGYSPGHAGFVTTLTNIVAPIGSMIAPVIAARMKDQRAVLLAGIGLSAIGLTGFLISPTGALGLAAAVLLGLGIGAMFALAILLFLLRSADSHTAALLSSMAQTLGYLLSAAGPFAFGLLHDATGGWTVPLCLLLALLAVEVPIALGAGRNRQIQA
jgi:MFS transporter, CP family, cyanate transporter